LCFGESKPELDERQEQIESFLRDRLRLSLKAQASRLAPVTEGISWLGVRVFPGTLRLQRERWIRFQRKFRQREQAFARGQLPEKRFLDSVNGLMEQIRWGNTLRLRQNFLQNRVAFPEELV
ncbi:hypothetical protein WDW89_12285, partial [Deltaproteobacteria bacterium TL4]